MNSHLICNYVAKFKRNEQNRMTHSMIQCNNNPISIMIPFGLQKIGNAYIIMQEEKSNHVMQKYAKTRITMYAVFVTLQYIRKYMVPRKDASCDCLKQRLLRVQLLYRIVLLQFMHCMCLDLIEHVCVCVCLYVCLYHTL